MKKVLILFIFIVFGIGIGFDLKYGTLEQTSYKIPNQMAAKTPEVVDEEEININYVEVSVKAGQTVLSIVEGLHSGNSPVSIKQIVKDFEALNKKVEAQTIQSGKKYRFPIYE
jgi:hypothetical protein